MSSMTDEKLDGPFAPVSKALSEAVEAAAVGLWVHLRLHGNWTTDGPRRGWLKISQKTLAKNVKMSVPKLRRLLAVLVDAGYLDAHEGRKRVSYDYRARLAPLGAANGSRKVSFPDRSENLGKKSSKTRKETSEDPANLGKILSTLTRSIEIEEGGADTVDSPAAARTETPPPESIKEKPAAKLQYPDHCQTHRFDPDPPPCGGCAKVRTANEKRRQDEKRKQADEKKRAKTEGQNAGLEELRRKKRNCTRGCDDNGYLNGWPCSHEPEQAASSNGPAVARAAARGELEGDELQGEALEALLLGFGGSDQSKLLGVPPADTPEQAATGNAAAANGKRRHA